MFFASANVTIIGGGSEFATLSDNNTYSFLTFEDGVKLHNSNFSCEVLRGTTLNSLDNDVNGYSESFTVTSVDVNIVDYTVVCTTTSGTSGTFSGVYEFTNSGTNPERNLNGIVSILALGFFIFALLKMTYNIDDEDHAYIKLLLMFVSFILMVTLLYLALQFVIVSNLSLIIINGFTTVYRVGMWTMYLFFAYFMFFYFIPKMFMWINDNIIKKGGKK